MTTPEGSSADQNAAFSNEYSKLAQPAQETIPQVPTPEVAGFKVKFKTGTRVAVERGLTEAQREAGETTGTVELDWETRSELPTDLNKIGQYKPLVEGFTRVFKPTGDEEGSWKDVRSDRLAAVQPGFQTGQELALPDRPGQSWRVESQSVTGAVKIVRESGEAEGPGVLTMSGAELKTLVDTPAEPVLKGLEVHRDAQGRVIDAGAPGPRFVDPEPQERAATGGAYEGRTKLPTVAHAQPIPGSQHEASKPSLRQRLFGGNK